MVTNADRRSYQRDYMRRYRAVRGARCRDCNTPRAASRVFCAFHAAVYSRGKRLWYERLKRDIFNHYGKRCVCCGESDERFLTIDHINNDGAEHRRRTGGGGEYTFIWLRKNGFPAGFQTLCWNCNCAKGHSNDGVCPHILFLGFKDGAGI